MSTQNKQQTNEHLLGDLLTEATLTKSSSKGEREGELSRLWEHYQNLREEIIHADNVNFQIIGIVVGAVGLILATGFNQSDPLTRSFIFLTTYTVTLAGYRLIQGNRRRTWRITTYLRVFLETELNNIKWESRLDIQSRRRRKNWNVSSLIHTNEWFIISMLNSITGLLVILLGVLQISIDSNLKLFFTIIVVIGNFILLANTYLQERDLQRGGKVEETFYISWKQIRLDEEK